MRHAVRQAVRQALTPGRHLMAAKRAEKQCAEPDVAMVRFREMERVYCCLLVVAGADPAVVTFEGKGHAEKGSRKGRTEVNWAEQGVRI